MAATSEFDGKCNWSSLVFDDWSIADLLVARPEFADRFDLSTIDGQQWATILEEQPQLAAQGDEDQWADIDGFYWSFLLAKQPQFADKCDWSKLGPEDWERLLARRPEFAAFKPKN